MQRQEIVFDKVKENKINALKGFYKSFVELESGLRNRYWSVKLADKTAEEEAIKGLFTKWIEFKTHFLFLNIFLKQEERKLFKELGMQKQVQHNK